MSCLTDDTHSRLFQQVGRLSCVTSLIFQTTDQWRCARKQLLRYWITRHLLGIKVMATSQRALEGKVAIITGSSSGIGEAISIEYARQGALVTLNGRNVQLLESVEKKCIELAGSPDKVLTVVGDVTVEEIRFKLIEETVKKFGKIDVLVNNAGHHTGKRLEDDFELSRLDDMLDIHVRVPFHLIKLAIPHLVESKGNIINISSVAGMKTLSTVNIEYSIAKAGMDHMTRVAGLELGPKNVRVNAINPGAIETPILYKFGLSDEYLQKWKDTLVQSHALGRLGKSEEVASAAVYLASEGASFVTGLTMAVDGGLLLMPPMTQSLAE